MIDKEWPWTWVEHIPPCGQSHGFRADVHWEFGDAPQELFGVSWAPLTDEDLL